jgi:hypothetical protein
VALRKAAVIRPTGRGPSAGARKEVTPVLPRILIFLANVAIAAVMANYGGGGGGP